MADNIVILANEVSALMKSGTDCKPAIREILKSYQISNNWDYYFKKIGKELGKRKSKKRKVLPEEKKVVKRPPAQMGLFSNFRPKVTNHTL